MLYIIPAIQVSQHNQCCLDVLVSDISPEPSPLIVLFSNSVFLHCLNISFNTDSGILGLDVHKYFSEKGFHSVVLSRNHLNNNAVKYSDNIELDENLVLDYLSEEIENKFRYEYTFGINNSELNMGFGLEQSNYTNDTYKPIPLFDTVIAYNYNSKLNFFKYSFFFID